MSNYIIPGNELNLDEIYVALSVDDKGEGIVAFLNSHGSYPIVFGNPEHLEPTKGILKKMHEDTGQTIRIFKFKKAELVHEFAKGN